MPDQIPTLAAPLHATLVWCSQFFADNKREPTMRELERHLDIPIDFVRRRISILSARGLLCAGIGGKGGRTLTVLGERTIRGVERGAVELTRTGPKLAEQPSREARRYIGRLNAGWSLGKIARHYGVSRTAVADVRDRWFHLLKIREVRADAKRAVPFTQRETSPGFVERRNNMSRRVNQKTVAAAR